MEISLTDRVGIEVLRRIKEEKYPTYNRKKEVELH
jgi:hypothetical protein